MTHYNAVIRLQIQSLALCFLQQFVPNRVLGSIRQLLFQLGQLRLVATIFLPGVFGLDDGCFNGSLSTFELDFLGRFGYSLLLVLENLEFLFKLKNSFAF